MAKRKRTFKKQDRRQAIAPAQLDIIIPVYGRADLLKNCLSSVRDTLGDIKAALFLIEDQGPDYEQVANVHNMFKENARMIRNDQNRGFAWTVNRGVAMGRSPLALILNSDVTLLPGAIAAMMAEFDNNEEVGTVGPKLLFPEDSRDPTRPAGKVQHAGLAINLTGRVVHPNIGWSPDHPKVNQRLECQAVTGACLMTRRKVWNEVIQLYKTNGDPSSGAFNEVYGAGTYEDVEYCFAVRTLGHKVIYQPEAVGYHHVGASVMQTDSGFPIARNEHIFKARCGGMLIWDEWQRY